MHVDNIRKTIESLKASTTYDQQIYQKPCGTPGCIAGHAVIDAGFFLCPEDEDCFNEEGSSYEIEYTASKWFGLEEDEAYKLFSMHPMIKYGKMATKEDAIAVLENLIETGKVDWGVAP